MSLPTLPIPMRKKTTQYQFRCTEAWLKRVESAAEARDIPVAQYIREATSARMDADGIPPEPPPPKRPRKPPA